MGHACRWSAGRNRDAQGARATKQRAPTNRYATRLITDAQVASPSTMRAYRIAVDMMDNASALPTCPQQQKRPASYNWAAPTRLHDEAL